MKEFLTLHKALRKILPNLPVVYKKSQFKTLNNEEQLSQLENILQFIADENSNNPIFKVFLEVSELSFDGEQKLKEGYVLKRTGGRYGNEENCCN